MLQAAVVLALAAALAAVTLPVGAGAATGSTVVGATVPSATTVDVAGCPPRTADITSFGIVQPGDAQVTSLDCTVLFGSSNDTAMLRLHQEDVLEEAFWREAHGPVDPDFDGGAAFVAPDPPDGDERGRDVAVQADGKIVLAGTVDDGGTPRGLVARYLPDGTLKSSTTFEYDENGLVLGRSDYVTYESMGEVRESESTTVYEYEFDEVGNWTRKATMEDRGSGATLIELEVREIEYY